MWMITEALEAWAACPGKDHITPDRILCTREAEKGLERLRLQVSGDPGPHFLGLRVKLPNGAVAWNFDGPVERAEIFRQSPHDPDAWIVRGIARQAVPMIAWQVDGRFHVILDGSPCLYANGCSQRFDPAEGLLELRSGDDGETPGLAPSLADVMDLRTNADEGQRFTPGRVIPVFHAAGHVFEAVAFTVEGTDLRVLRRAVNLRVAQAFAPETERGAFGAYAFTTAWMNVRVNDTGRSMHWVVPQIAYFNRQYNRDAFWISMMLPPELSRDCLMHELARMDPQAEYPLMTVLWTLRLRREGVELPEAGLKGLREAFDLILSRGAEGWYHSQNPDSKRLDFQYWADVMAFDPADSVTYNQGLFALALLAGEEFGFAVPEGLRERAEANARGLFREEDGFYPQSRMKTGVTGVDMMVPDLLSHLLFGEPLFPYCRGAVEFQAILRGAARPDRDGVPDRLEPGPRLWVMGPDSVHGWRDDPGAESEILVFHFYDVNPVLLRALGPGQLLTRGLSRDQILQLRGLYDILSPHVRNARGAAPLWMDKVKAELSLLILSGLPPERMRDISLHAQTRVNQAVSWYRERLSQAPSVARVAKGLGVSTVHLRRLFQEVHGRSPHAVLHDVRMSTALQWLQEGGLRASEISDRLGFSEPSAFTRAFRRWHGTPPSRV